MIIRSISKFPQNKTDIQKCLKTEDCFLEKKKILTHVSLHCSSFMNRNILHMNGWLCLQNLPLCVSVVSRIMNRNHTLLLSIHQPRDCMRKPISTMVSIKSSILSICDSKGPNSIWLLSHLLLMSLIRSRIYNHFLISSSFRSRYVSNYVGHRVSNMEKLYHKHVAKWKAEFSNVRKIQLCRKGSKQYVIV